MKRTVYACDWCGAEEPEPEDDGLPPLWSYLTESDEEICGDCRMERNKAITAAMSRRSGKPDPNVKPAAPTQPAPVEEPQPLPDSALVTDEASVID